jgi:hypothetical protein
MLPLTDVNFRFVATKQDLSDAIDHPCADVETIDLLEQPYVASISYENAGGYEVSYMVNGTMDYFHGIVYGLTKMNVNFRTNGILELSMMIFHDF